MLRAVILPREAECGQVVVYPRFHGYKICITTQDSPDLEPVVFPTGLDTVVKAYAHLHKDITTLHDPELSRRLMAIRSQLDYIIGELLSPDDLYVQLEYPAFGTVRQYQYRLYFGTMPCYSRKQDGFVDEVMRVVDPSLGRVVVSTHALNVMGAPQWYAREIFRDMCDFASMDYVEGHNSGELYLFYKHDVDQAGVIEEIRGYIAAAIQARIFPRRTPEEVVKALRLSPIADGQWAIKYAIPNDTPIFSELFMASFVYDTPEKLHAFYAWLHIYPTYPFIEREIRVVGDKVVYATKYLPDYIRVLRAMHAELDKPLPSIPEATPPPDYTLDTRIKLDTVPL